MTALLCLHGLLSDNRDFVYLKSELQDYYDFIHIPDLPGHGENILSFTTNNTLSYVLSEYDRLCKEYDKVDVLGYSMGGVLACFLTQYRNVNRLILLAPAFNYINFENYKFSIIKKSKPYYKNNSTIKKFKYFLPFTSIVRATKNNICMINCPICILWGEDDYLVSRKSGFYLFNLCKNNIKSYATLKNHNHYNILISKEARDIIFNFLYK
ncbi:MAG: alpha/beta fold hydrolase [Erysipelotrichaceae bacterium]|nr:alpha/beta fold hydrolase [Erysipelotrichaceae bacterium]